MSDFRSGYSCGVWEDNLGWVYRDNVGCVSKQSEGYSVE